jgi:hypothetical protein
MSTRWSISLVQRTIGGHDQPNQEQVDDVEDTNTPDNLSRRSGDLFARIVGLGGGKAGQFCAAESE